MLHNYSGCLESLNDLIIDRMFNSWYKSFKASGTTFEQYVYNETESTCKMRIRTFRDNYLYEIY